MVNSQEEVKKEQGKQGGVVARWSSNITRRWSIKRKGAKQRRGERRKMMREDLYSEGGRDGGELVERSPASQG